MRRTFFRGLIAAPTLALALGLPVYAQSGGQSGSQSGQSGSASERDPRGQSSQSGSASQSGSRERGSSAEGGQSQQLDQHLATWLLIDNIGEIQLSQFAAERSQNEQVRQFAQQMVQEHTQMARQLEQVAGPMGQQMVQQLSSTSRQGGSTQGSSESSRTSSSTQSSSGQSSSADQSGTASSTNRASGSQTATGSASGVEAQLMQIKQEVAQQCLQAKQRLMAEKQGREFDMAYVGQQVLHHAEAHAALQVLANYAGPELQPILRQGTDSIQQHLERSMNLAKQISDGPETARRPSRESSQND